MEPSIRCVRWGESLCSAELGSTSTAAWAVSFFPSRRGLGQIYQVNAHCICIAVPAIIFFLAIEFDFLVPGVSSMSLDTHKYGYALKGASVVLYRAKELRHSQYFCYADWTGGMYTTPTVRPRLPTTTPHLPH